MGLRDYKSYKKRQELLEMLSSFGITEEDLKYLPEALKIVKNGRTSEQVKLTDAQKESIKDSYKDKITPEKMLEAFAGKVEEFYPNGRA